jgi:DNA-binding CsgD family transcriptional regulator
MNLAASIADSRPSFREVQILREVAAGLSNWMVAEKLRISEKTVKHYMSSIMQKYGVNIGSVALVMFLATSGSCNSQTVLKREPMMNRGTVVLVDDGSCPKGQIKQVTAQATTSALKSRAMKKKS